MTDAQMNADQKAFFRSEYLRYSIEQLEELTERMVTNRDSFAVEAREAWKEVLFERKLDAQSLLGNRQAIQADNLRQQTLAIERKDERSKRTTRLLGKSVGFLGIPLSIGIAGLSIANSHAGGLVAAVATLGCSIWMAFYYKGD